jgi:hypothetical protein
MASPPMFPAQHPVAQGAPNHRQQLALERLEFAVGELGSVLLSCCREPGVAKAVIRDVRTAVIPVLADILSVG